MNDLLDCIDRLRERITELEAENKRLRGVNRYFGEQRDSLTQDLIEAQRDIHNKHLIITDLEKDYKVMRENVFKLNAKNRELRKGILADGSSGA